MSLDFRTTEIQPQPILGIRATTSMEGIPALMGSLFGEVHGYIQHTGNQPAGMPLARYHSMDQGEVELECAMPVATSIEGTDRVVPSSLPGGLVATVTHFGPYTALPETWRALTEWIDSQGLQPAGAPWEVYVTDPGAEPDESKWRTDIFFPVR